MRLTFVALCALACAFGSRAAAQEIRTVPHRYGVPLAKQVKCAPRETIHFPPGRHGIVFDDDITAESYIDYALDISDFGLVFLADDVKSSLTENDSWILTRVSGFVEEVMWFKKSKLPRYSRLTIELRDGAMEVNGCRVITGRPVPIESGHRYLVFLDELQGPYGIPTVDPIWIREDRHLESPSVPVLRDAHLDLVRARIRAEPSRRLLNPGNAKQ